MIASVEVVPELLVVVTRVVLVAPGVAVGKARPAVLAIARAIPEIVVVVLTALAAVLARILVETRFFSVEVNT